MKISNNTKAAILGWALVIFALLINAHRTFIILPLWGLAWLGEKADLAADWWESNTPTFFQKTIDKWKDKAESYLEKDE